MNSLNITLFFSLLISTRFGYERHAQQLFRNET